MGKTYKDSKHAENPKKKKCKHSAMEAYNRRQNKNFND